MKKYIRKHKNILILSFVAILISTFVSINAQFLKGDLLDFAISLDKSKIYKTSILLFSFLILELITSYVFEILRFKFTSKAMNSLRIDYFNSILSRHITTFFEKGSKRYTSQYSNQMEMIQRMYFMTFPMLIEVIVQIVFISASLFIIDYRIAIITLILLTTPLYIPKFAEKMLQKYQIQYKNSYEEHISKLQDWLSNFEVIKNYSIENIILGKFMDSSNNLEKGFLNTRKTFALSRILAVTLSYISNFIIIIISISFLYKKILSVGEFFSVVNLVNQLSYPITTITTFIQNLVSIKPIKETMEKFLLISDSTETKILLENKNTKYNTILQYKNVSFGYNSQDLLFKNLNLSFNKGKKYLIKGESGSGKTTIVNLLLGYHVPLKGYINFYNFNISSILNIEDHITIMRQDTLFFEDTLKNNLTMYNQISNDRVIEYLKRVGLDKYANEHSLNVIVKEGGNNFSGGEKRRLSLIRSLLSNKELLILDEPLENLDSETSRLISDIICRANDKTLIMISHKFPKDMMRYFDKIIDINKMNGL